MKVSFSKINHIEVDGLFIFFRFAFVESHGIFIQFKPFRENVSDTYVFPNPMDSQSDFTTYGSGNVIQIKKYILQAIKQNPAQTERIFLPKLWQYGHVYLLVKDGKKYLEIRDCNDESGNSTVKETDFFFFPLSQKFLSQMLVCISKNSIKPIGYSSMTHNHLGIPMTQSIQSRIIPTVLRLMRMKQPSLSLESHPNSTPAKPSNRITSKYRVSSQMVNGHNVWTIAPKNTASTSSSSHQHVLYLHGGSYVYGFNAVHWAFMTKLIDRLGCTVIAPDYPLAPTHQAPETVRFVLEQYRDLSTAVGAKNVTVMGDSAGAGLALVLAQQLRTANLEQPANLILLSPWLDLSMTNPGIQNADALDPMLSVSGLQQAAKMYAGELSLNDPLVSPLYGSLEELAPITLFIGTFDVLHPDCQVLKAKAESLGVRFAYHEVERMVHVWMLLPMPEANRVMDQIVNMLERRW